MFGTPEKVMQDRLLLHIVSSQIQHGLGLVIVGLDLALLGLRNYPQHLGERRLHPWGSSVVLP